MSRASGTGAALALPFVPYGPRLKGVPHVFVDGLRTDDTVLELSHWPGNRTPEPFRADVSSQSVLALLADGRAEEHLSGAAAVTCDHYDVDGLLSVWSLTSPDAAMARRDLVEAAALTGDFDLWTSAGAVRACLALEAAERVVAGEIGRRRLRSTGEVTAALFRALLDRVVICLDDPAAVDGWQSDWEAVQSSMRRLDLAPGLVQEVDDLDLVVVEPGARLHAYAVNARTERLHVLGEDGPGRYWLKFRYESFVDLRSRPTRPRVRGDILAAELNESETAGTWFCEGPDTATPCLQMYAAGKGVPAPSALSWDEFVDHAVDFFRRAETDPGLRWARSDDWHATATVAPPSGRSS